MKDTILAIDTATDACSVALMKEGKVASHFQLAPREHIQLIFPMIQSLLSQANMTLAEVEAIAVGRGPGSFTGVRVAMSIAQGLAYGLNKPIYGVSTLTAIAYQAKKHVKETNAIFVPALDARMQEIYTAAFEIQNDVLHTLCEETVCAPQTIFENMDLLSICPKIIAIGSGWDVYYQEIQKNYAEFSIHFIPNCYPHAEHIALIANDQIIRGVKGVLANEALPVYLRDNVAKKSSVS